MFAMFRLIVLILLIEALFFVLLRIYIRSLQHEKLEKIWAERHPELAGNTRERDEFVRKSMVGFEKTLKSRLTWAIFVIPTVAILGIVYWVNWQ